MLKLTIDRIEGNVAVLISRRDESLHVTLPVLLLPPGSREGDIVSLIIETDPEETEKVRDRVADLASRLNK